jgi:hypothetical protein
LLLLALGTRAAVAGPTPRLGSFSLLSYNVAFVDPPLDIGAQPCLEERARGIAETLLTDPSYDYDVILLQETFDPDAYDDVLHPLLEAKYPYHVDRKPPGAWPAGDINGGLSVLSKLPFLPLTHLSNPYPWPGHPMFYAQEFHECDGFIDDCMVSKGWLHVRIAVGGVPISLINTHLQATTDPAEQGENDVTRKAQMAEIAGYIRWTVWPNYPEDLVLVAGDTNIRSPSESFPSTDPRVRQYFDTIGQYFGSRDAWRESYCSSLGGSDVWTGGGATNHSGDRLDLVLFYQGNSRWYTDPSAPELHPRTPVLRRFPLSAVAYLNLWCEYCAPWPNAGCSDHPMAKYPDPVWVRSTLSDHFGVATVFDIYEKWAAPPYNTQCGPVPPDPPGGGGSGGGGDDGGGGGSGGVCEGYDIETLCPVWEETACVPGYPPAELATCCGCSCIDEGPGWDGTYFCLSL